jgi:hypothetical protein
MNNLEPFDLEEIQVLIDWGLSHCKHCRGLRAAIAIWLRGQVEIPREVLASAIQVIAPEMFKYEDGQLHSMTSLMVPEIVTSSRHEVSEVSLKMYPTQATGRLNYASIEGYGVGEEIIVDLTVRTNPGGAKAIRNMVDRVIEIRQVESMSLGSLQIITANIDVHALATEHAIRSVLVAIPGVHEVDFTQDKDVINNQFIVNIQVELEMGVHQLEVSDQVNQTLAEVVPVGITTNVMYR